MLRSIMIAVVVVIVITNSCLADGYSAIEVYPAGDIFICSGRGILDGRVNISTWTVGSDISVTVGPQIGPVALGIGASVISTEDGLQVGYVNLNAGFGMDIGSVHLQSYNLYQMGRNGVGNFALSRNWLSYGSLPVGIVGHNIRVGDNPVVPFWGVYAQLGTMGIFSSNRICLAVNVRDSSTLWAAWNIGF